MWLTRQSVSQSVTAAGTSASQFSPSAQIPFGTDPTAEADIFINTASHFSCHFQFLCHNELNFFTFLFLIPFIFSPFPGYALSPSIVASVCCTPCTFSQKLEIHSYNSIYNYIIYNSI
jgi:hypothetical protein